MRARGDGQVVAAGVGAGGIDAVFRGSDQIGRVAATELLARIAGGTAAGVRLLPGRLIVRESSRS